MITAREQHDIALVELRQRLALLGQHTPNHDRCGVCLTPWPCKIALQLTADLPPRTAKPGPLPGDRCNNTHPDAGRCVAEVDVQGAHLGMHTNGRGRRWKNTGPGR